MISKNNKQGVSGQVKSSRLKFPTLCSNYM